MVAGGRLAAFAAVAFVIAAIPGPSVLFVVGRALAHGRRAALISMLGNEAGEWVLCALVAFGVGSVLQRSALMFTVIKLAGAGYLGFLGVGGGRGTRHQAERAEPRHWRCARARPIGRRRVHRWRGESEDGRVLRRRPAAVR